MPFRPVHNTIDPCRICSIRSEVRCRNCETFHCDPHLEGGRCARCEAWLSAKVEKRVARLYESTGKILALLLAVAYLVVHGMSSGPFWSSFGDLVVLLGGLVFFIGISLRIETRSPKRIRQELADRSATYLQGEAS